MTRRGPCLTRAPTRSHHGHRVSAPMIPVMQASLPQEHLTKETLRYQPTRASGAAYRIVISSSRASFAVAGASRITLALCSLDSSCIRPDAFEESPNEQRETPTRICIDRESSHQSRASYAEESPIACHLCFLASRHLPRFTSSVCLSTDRGAPLHLGPTVPGRAT